MTTSLKGRIEALEAEENLDELVIVVDEEDGLTGEVREAYRLHRVDGKWVEVASTDGKADRGDAASSNPVATSASE
ncbi:MAG TPA: hypothetical protein VN812_10015 [Candidatus Acidoferrales bacterium]|nr:hypothetical protein [Candidatus Acidoferrales bacterium]